MISISTPGIDAVIARAKARIDAKVKARTEQIANNVWIGVIGGAMGSDYPYWSGGYTVSWNFNEGPATGDYVPSERDQPGAYAPQGVTLQNIYRPYTLVTIYNANPVAAQVEHRGTPTHQYPWKVAYSAYSVATKYV